MRAKSEKAEFDTRGVKHYERSAKEQRDSIARLQQVQSAQDMTGDVRQAVERLIGLVQTCAAYNESLAKSGVAITGFKKGQLSVDRRILDISLLYSHVQGTAAVIFPELTKSTQDYINGKVKTLAKRVMSKNRKGIEEREKETCPCGTL